MNKSEAHHKADHIARVFENYTCAVVKATDREYAVVKATKGEMGGPYYVERMNDVLPREQIQATYKLVGEKMVVTWYNPTPKEQVTP